MRFHMSLLLAAAASVAAAAACSSTPTTTEEPVATATASSDMTGSEPSAVPTSDPVPTATATATATASAPPPPAKPAWKDMSHDQKMELMKAEVMPKFSKMFQEVDAKKFAKMDCATCHGAGADKTGFKMPNAKLPKLDPADNFKKHTKQQAMLDFMFKMTPAMAETLNAPKFDPATGSGLGCMTCHTMAGGKAGAPPAKK